jgi:hypothetical protein
MINCFRTLVSNDITNTIWQAREATTADHRRATTRVAPTMDGPG